MCVHHKETVQFIEQPFTAVTKVAVNNMEKPSALPKAALPNARLLSRPSTQPEASQRIRKSNSKLSRASSNRRSRSQSVKKTADRTSVNRRRKKSNKSISSSARAKAAPTLESEQSSSVSNSQRATAQYISRGSRSQRSKLSRSTGKKYTRPRLSDETFI